jgi:hypothetical protein
LNILLCDGLFPFPRFVFLVVGGEGTEGDNTPSSKHHRKRKKQRENEFVVDLVYTLQERGKRIEPTL